MSETYRVIITGSRTWPTPSTIGRDLYELRRGLDSAATLVVVVGDCPAGADAAAKRMAPLIARRADLGVIEVEEHEAEWWANGRAAGPMRNQAMVAAGADRCLAYLDRCALPRCANSAAHGSHGATDCLRRAEAAGIPTTVKKWGW